jgi:hypothetical protein
MFYKELASLVSATREQANMHNAESQGVFAMIPPDFAPAPDLPD